VQKSRSVFTTLLYQNQYNFENITENIIKNLVNDI